MVNPLSGYSDDARDFLVDYKKNIVRDPRLERYQYVLKEFGNDYERAYQLINTFQAEAYKDQSFYLGNQWSLEELAYLQNQRRAAFTYNRTRRVVNLVQGYQRKNRLSICTAPVEGASEETSSLFTDTIQHVMEMSDGYETISDAFKGALVSGLSFISPYIDYRSDPVSGDIKLHLDDWNAVIFDPFLTKRDLSDCSFLSRRKFLSQPEVISLIPDKADLIERLPYGTRDDKFTYMPYARQWGSQKLLNYNEYWKANWKIKDVLVDMETGETRPWTGDKKRLALYQSQFPQIQVIKKPVRSVDLGIIVEGELLYYGEDPFGLDDYPFVPFFCVFEPSYDLWTWKLQSLVRIVRDPQTELNKRRSALVQSIDASLQSGWKAKRNALVNPTSLYKSGHGQVIWMKDEAQLTDAEQLQPPGVNPALFQLEQEFEKDIMEIAGVNAELFGMSENDKVETAGILAKMRQSAGLVNLQDIFDGLRQSQKILGRKILTLIQKNYTPEKIALITKRQVTPEFYSKSFSEYSIVVEEGILTDTQRQSQFTQYLALKAMGVEIPEHLIIKNSNLHDKSELEQVFQQRAEQQQKMEQLQLQQAIQQQEVLTESLESKAASDRALAAERVAKIQLDSALNAERLARAEEDRTAGLLNLLKAVKELEQIDVATLREKIEILRGLEDDQREEEESSSANISTSSEENR